MRLTRAIFRVLGTGSRCGEILSAFCLRKYEVVMKILSGEIPCDELYSDDKCLAFKDVTPQAPVHILTIPKSKYSNFSSCAENASDKELSSVCPGMDVFVDHIDYIVKMIGIDYVGVGSDYDGLDCLPKGWNDCMDHMLIVQELEKRGYSSEEIEKVMGKNILRVLEEVWA